MKTEQKKDRLERQILFYFDFLVTGFSFTYRKKSYPDYMGFPGPICVYSFYNDNGCLSFHYTNTIYCSVKFQRPNYAAAKCSRKSSFFQKLQSY